MQKPEVVGLHGVIGREAAGGIDWSLRTSIRANPQSAFNSVAGASLPVTLVKILPAWGSLYSPRASLPTR